MLDIALMVFVNVSLPRKIFHPFTPRRSVKKRATVGQEITEVKGNRLATTEMRLDITDQVARNQIKYEDSVISTTSTFTRRTSAARHLKGMNCV